MKRESSIFAASPLKRNATPLSPLRRVGDVLDRFGSVSFAEGSPQLSRAPAASADGGSVAAQGLASSPKNGLARAQSDEQDATKRRLPILRPPRRKRVVDSEEPVSPSADFDPEQARRSRQLERVVHRQRPICTSEASN